MNKNKVLRNLAGLKEGVNGEPYGIDDLFLGAVHNRAFISALYATEDKKFLGSFLFSVLSAGSTYSIVMNIAKLYDRKQKMYSVNSLRELFKSIKMDEKTSKIILNQFNTENSESLFVPIINYRDKCLAHNEMVTEITWEQIDEAIYFYSYVWDQIGIYIDSPIMKPFYDFDRVSEKFRDLFNHEQINSACIAWNDYISKIKNAMKKLSIKT